MGDTDTHELQQRNRELSILNSIAEALNREVDLERALETTLTQVAGLLGLETGWIWLLSEDNDEPYLAAALNLPPGLANDRRRMQGSCYCLDTFRAGDLNGAANVNVITCSRLKKLVDGTGGLRYHASIPLYAQTRKIGVLNVASRDWRELSADDLRLLYTLGDMVGIAIQRARLYMRSAQLGAAEERNRLAREIHDTLAQGLTAIVLQLETADALLENKVAPEQAQQAVALALALARANLEEARRSVHDLRAATLEGQTLGQALARLIADLGAGANLEINYAQAGAERPLPIRIEAGMYRIAQEALANILRHAYAQHASVELDATPDAIWLAIEDDGRGFDPLQIPPGRYGLVGLKERVKLLGGTLRLQSNPGTGTRIEVSVPLEDRH